MPPITQLPRFPRSFRPVLTTAQELRARAVQRSRRAWKRIAVMAPVLAGLLLLNSHREQLFGVDEPVRLAVAVTLVILGWAFARQMGSAFGGRLSAKLD